MTTAEKLNDAEIQYHLLLTGQKARVYVDQNGERVEYTSTTASRLLQYINSLKLELGIISNGSGGNSPLGAFF